MIKFIITNRISGTIKMNDLTILLHFHKLFLIIVEQIFDFNTVFLYKHYKAKERYCDIILMTEIVNSQEFNNIFL